MEWIFDTSNMFTIKCMYILYRAFNTFNMSQLVLYSYGTVWAKIKGYVEGVKSGVCGCIQSNVTHVSKVNFFIYYVLHCMNKRSKGMSKVSKETQNTQ